jgi:hypothetical protein
MLIAALVFCALIALAIAFQIALAAGVPWGELAMGGRYPGRLPQAMRVAATVQALVLAALAGVVLVRAGLVLPALLDGAPWAIWLVVVLCLLSAVLNLVTPSRKERLLWGPVGVALFVCSLVVALD